MGWKNGHLRAGFHNKQGFFIRSMSVEFLMHCDYVLFPSPEYDEWREMRKRQDTMRAVAIEVDVKRAERQRSINRALEAERREEVDVCRDCYRHYLPMRKLQEIYPDWPPSVVPQCDYCEKQAKYHVRRSDWITFEKVETK